MPESVRGVFDRPAVTIMRACALVGVSRRTIYNWLALNKVEWYRTAGGAVRIYADSLVRPGVFHVRAAANCQAPGRVGGRE